jgi:hypothetical protein
LSDEASWCYPFLIPAGQSHVRAIASNEARVSVTRSLLHFSATHTVHS